MKNTQIKIMPQTGIDEKAPVPTIIPIKVPSKISQIRATGSIRKNALIIYADFLGLPCQSSCSSVVNSYIIYIYKK